jgi:hypothetical protein
MRARQTAHDPTQQHSRDDGSLGDRIEEGFAVDAVKNAVGFRLHRGGASHPLQEADLTEVCFERRKDARKS